MAEDFFSNLANTFQSPQMQSALMSISGTPYEVQAPILQQQARNQAAQQEQQARAMLEGIISKGDLTDEDVLRVFTLSPELGKALVSMRQQTTLQDPAAVREYQYYSGLSPKEQQEYLGVKRAQQIMNLGGTQAVYNPVDGGIREQFAVTPKPEQMPQFKQEQERAKVIGKESGTASATLESAESKLPQLFQTVQKLDKLAEEATYTIAGQGLDIARRELGYEPRPSAVTRKEYISLVDNQILPLLRDTFGAQFTQKEGESLKATLGDANASPAEKQAVLKSFIEQKIANIQSLQRQTGKDVTNIEPPSLSSELPQGLPEGARQAPDGNYYVERNGKFFKVNPQ